MRYSTCRYGITTTVQLSARSSRVSVVGVDGNGASADITPSEQVTRVVISVPAGHLPTRLRRDLMDAVFELPGLRSPTVLAASIPLGDMELLTEFRRRCDHVSTRAAGATCLVDASIAAGR
jgi:hypothetical protein